MKTWQMTYGSKYVRCSGAEFRVWAPNLHELSVKIVGQPERMVSMTRVGEDFEVIIPDVHAGDRYSLVLD